MKYMLTSEYLKIKVDSYLELPGNIEQGYTGEDKALA